MAGAFDGLGVMMMLLKIWDEKRERRARVTKHIRKNKKEKKKEKKK